MRDSLVPANESHKKAITSLRGSLSRSAARAIDTSRCAEALVLAYLVAWIKDRTAAAHECCLLPFAVVLAQPQVAGFAVAASWALAAAS
jgi:hypothetical protein